MDVHEILNKIKNNEMSIEDGEEILKSFPMRTWVLPN